MDNPTANNAGDAGRTINFGLLEPLMQDEAISEILVDDYQTVYVERYSKLERVSTNFRDNAHLMEVIQGIVEAAGHHVGNNCPMTNIHLLDGTQINVVVPPIAIKGPCLTIRKAARSLLTIEDLRLWPKIT